MPAVLASFTPNRALTIGLFLGLVLFTIGAAGALLSADPKVLGSGLTLSRISIWVALVLCPIYAADILMRLVRGTPTLVATDEGVAMRSILGFTAPIPWAEIDHFAPEVISKKLWLGIYLKDPRRTLAGYPMLKRFLHIRSHDAGTPNITYRHIHLGANPVDAAARLQEILEQQKAGVASTSH